MRHDRGVTVFSQVAHLGLAVTSIHLSVYFVEPAEEETLLRLLLPFFVLFRFFRVFRGLSCLPSWRGIMSEPIRHRIKGHRRVRAGDLVPHELNFRGHPELQ